MLKIMGLIIDLVIVTFSIVLVIAATLETGVFGFFFSMGYLFVVLIAFVLIMTIIEKVTTGKWWFNNPKYK